MFWKHQEIIYYIKIFYDILTLKNKVRFQQKLEVKFEVEDVSLGVKKVLVVLVKDLSVLHNGVVIHHRRELIGNTGHQILGKYDRPHPPKGFIELYEHGNPVRFRDIWIRPLGEYDKP